MLATVLVALLDELVEAVEDVVPGTVVVVLVDAVDILELEVTVELLVVAILLDVALPVLPVLVVPDTVVAVLVDAVD